MANQSPDIQLDERRLREIEEKISRLAQTVYESQSFSAALIGGCTGAVGGAMLWAFVASYVQQNVSWMALAVGCCCGLAIRLLGKGIDLRFGLLSIVCTIFGCVLGTLLANGTVVARRQGLSLLDLLATPSRHVAAVVVKLALDWAVAALSVLAAYLAFRLAFRSLSPEESAALLQPRIKPNPQVST